MARYGMPYGAGYGTPAKSLEYVNVDLSNDGRWSMAVKARSGRGDAWFAVFCNAVKIAHVYVPEGEEVSVSGETPWGVSRPSFCVMRLGAVGDDARNYSRVARTFESTDAKRVTLTLTFTPEIIGTSYTDSGYCSNWSLSGLYYGANCDRVSGSTTRGKLRLDLSVAGSSVTVDLYNRSGTRKVATGTGTVGGSVTLVQQNGSGLSGSVTIAADAVTVSDASLFARWPASVQVLRDTSDPPSTAVATIAFKGENAARWTETSDLSAGTHYYRVRPVSDTGSNGTESASLALTINAAPEPPSAIAYASGNAAATLVDVTAAITATHNLYLQQCDGEYIDLIDAAQAYALTAGANQIALPAITGYPGKARLVLRCTSGGVEEKNINIYELEYDESGDYVAPRPNFAALDARSESITSGLDISIGCRYNSSEEQGTATQVKLFVRDDETAAYDYDTPVDTQSLADGPANIKTATFTYTFPSAGWYYLRAVAYTAAGVSSVVENCPEHRVYVSASTMPAASNVSAVVARG